MRFRSSSHTLASVTLRLQGRKNKGRCLRIHQPHSGCSAWACCDSERAGTEFPKHLFSSSCPCRSAWSPLVSVYNRELSVPASCPFRCRGARWLMGERHNSKMLCAPPTGQREQMWCSTAQLSYIWVNGGQRCQLRWVIVWAFPFPPVHWPPQSKIRLQPTKIYPLSSPVQMQLNCLLFSEQPIKLKQQRCISFNCTGWCHLLPLVYREKMNRKDGGVQLKRMDSGSLLANCAMCFNMSFLVMMPNSLLMTQTEERRGKCMLLLITVKEPGREQKHTYCTVSGQGLTLYLHTVTCLSFICPKGKVPHSRRPELSENTQPSLTVAIKWPNAGWHSGC